MTATESLLSAAIYDNYIRLISGGNAEKIIIGA